MTDVLDVRLGESSVGKLILLTGDRSFFAFEEAYLNDPDRPVLSQSFVAASGEIIPETRPVQTRLPAFFSNLLPEGHLREYLARRGGVKPVREFKLIELLGEDLPGAVVIKPFEGRGEASESEFPDEAMTTADQPYRFSLAGVQLKFSALSESTGGLTIPASGVGGDWIIKLPAQNFAHVPENEWAMLHWAGEVGIPVPETRLVRLDQIAGLPELGVLSGTTALAVKRFDRHEKRRIHIEDFAQVYNVFPEKKYEGVSTANMANMVWILTGEDGLIDFIRRLVFTILIGNGDMHLKNWSFVYPDGRNPELSPAYDFVSTIAYIPSDRLALNLSGEKNIRAITLEHFEKLVRKAGLPEYLVLSAVKETMERALDKWSENKTNYALPGEILERIEKHLAGLRINDWHST
ncbi:MAG: HipA domain-containing protein [Gammaproteobacteria bacterium]|jgi:serine/threonine-protein kinase HipA